MVTPLTWSVFGDGVERAMRGAYCDLGVLADATPPADVESRLWALFYGRAAGNPETFRWLGDRTPGSDGDAVEAQIFGSVRPGRTSSPLRRRYPVVALKLPVAVALVAPRLRHATADIHPWWQRSVARPPVTQADARARFADAVQRFEGVMRPHTLAAMLCQALYEQVRAAAERAGHEGLETSLVTGYGEMAETRVVAEWWAVARGRSDLGAFIARNGFHGPNEGEMSARVWRMDQAPLERLLRSYRLMDEHRDPLRIEAARTDRRREAERELLAATPPASRVPVRGLLWLASRVIPLRGVGKASFLQCNDVMRLAARTLGKHLVERGLLDDVDDVFMLTQRELLDPHPDAHLLELARSRRAIDDAYRSLALPEVWEGMPTPTARRAAPQPPEAGVRCRSSPASPSAPESSRASCGWWSTRRVTTSSRTARCSSAAPPIRAGQRSWSWHPRWSSTSAGPSATAPSWREGSASRASRARATARSSFARATASASTPSVARSSCSSARRLPRSSTPSEDHGRAARR